MPAAPVDERPRHEPDEARGLKQAKPDGLRDLARPERYAQNDQQAEQQQHAEGAAPGRELERAAVAHRDFHHDPVVAPDQRHQAERGQGAGVGRAAQEILGRKRAAAPWRVIIMSQHGTGGFNELDDRCGRSAEARSFRCCGIVLSGLALRQAAPPQPAAPRRFGRRRRSPQSSSSRNRASGWITNGGNVFNQRYSPLTQINRDTVATPEAELARRAQRLRQREQVLRPGTAARARWRDLHGHGRRRRVRNRRRDRRDAVDVSREARRQDRQRLLRMVEPRARARRRQSLCRPARRQARRTRSAHGQGRVVDAGGALAGRLHDHGGPALLRRPRDHGVRGRRSCDARPAEGVQRAQTDRSSGRSTRSPDPASRATRLGRRTTTPGSTAAHRSGKRRPSTRSSGSSTSRRAIRAPTSTAACARATISTRSSIVALEASTGRYRWHFQEVHHDLWDYDAPNPVVLFDAPIAGQERKGIAEVGKTGFTYILDRTNGKPLIGIEERAVPQEPRQATAATQPYPIGDPIVPHEIDIAPEGFQVVNQGRIFTPFWDKPVLAKPQATGGANWPPSSYDPETHLLYVCAHDGISAYSSDGETSFMKPEPGNRYAQGTFGRAGIRVRGIFAAVDLTTNKLAWRQQWSEMCYSGLDRDERRARVRRPQRQPVHGARQEQRQVALGFPDGCGRQRDGEHVRAQGQAVRRRARGAARSSPARSTATACGCSRSTANLRRAPRRALRPRRRRTPATDAGGAR